MNRSQLQSQTASVQQWRSRETDIRAKTAYALNIKRSASGCLKHDYLVPAGPYEEQWDWDAFFMAIALIKENKSNGIYMKNWALNYLDNARDDGWVAGCITPEGADPRLNHMKPLLAQGCLIASEALNDLSWLEPHIARLIAIVEYRPKNLWHADYDMPVWFDSMESGADNNLASFHYPNKSVVSVDVCGFMYAEFLAMKTIAGQFQLKALEKQYDERAVRLQAQVEHFLFSEEAGLYLNLNTLDGALIPCVAYSSFVPLWIGMTDAERSKRAIRTYLLNTNHLQSPYGFRTLSKQDTGYNNVNMIKPHSNWQGPVWPLAQYIYMQGLLQYGFINEAFDCAEQTASLVLKDIEQTSGMHENYDAETGEPLAAPGFVSWNILVRSMISDCLAAQQ